MANSKIPNITLADTLNTQRLRINQLLDSVGDVSTLTTTERNITEAINEHDAELGEIDAYIMGTSAGTVSGAIQELDGRLDSINDTQLSTPKIYVSDSNATNHIKGTVNIDTDLNVNGNVDIDTNLTVHGNLVVDGTTAISAGANGNINLGDGLQDSDTVIFNAEIGSHIVPGSDDLHDIGSDSKEFRHGYFDGTVNADELAADSATIGTLKVTDLTNNRVTIAGASGELEDDGNFTFDGTVLSVGNTSIDIGATGINTTGLEADSATITANADITGNLDVGGNFTADGNVDLGNASTDTVSINGQVDTDIVPSEGNKRSLGSGTKQWLNGYFDGTVNADELAADSATIGTLKVTDLTNGRIVIVGSGDEIADDADLTYNTTTDTLAVSNIDIGTSAALASAKVEDLTDNRIVIAGASGELEDNAGLTYDGKTFNVGQGEFTVDSVGRTYIKRDLFVDDSANIENNLRVGQNLTVKGDFEVNGLFTTTGQTNIAGSEIVLNSGIAIDNSNRPGIGIDRDTADSAVIRWNEQSDYWEIGYIHAGTDSFWKIAIDNHNADFADITATDISSTGNLSATGNLNVDGLTTLDSTTVNGDMEVVGNFTVTGTTTYINTETVTIDDNIIVLNDNATGVPAAGQDAGIEIERGSRTNVQLLWDEDQGYWVSATDSGNTLSRIATANWIDATAPISFNSSTGNISHNNSGVSAGTYGSVTVDAKGHVTAGSNPAFDNYVSWTAADSAGDTYTITSGDTFKIKGDGFISSDWSANDVLTIYHPKVGAASQNNSGGTFIQDVTMDSYGHVTAMGTGSVSNSTITISPRNGLKTGGNFSLNGSAQTVYIDIDSAELRDEFIEKLVYDQITLNGPAPIYPGNLRSTNGSFRLSDDTSDTTSRPVSLGLMNTDTTLSDDAVLADVNFEGENTNGARITYSRIEGSAVDVSAGTEDGQLELKSGRNGTLYTGLDLNSGISYLKSYDRLYLQSEEGASTRAKFRFENPTTAANTSKPSYLEIYNNNPSPTAPMHIGSVEFHARQTAGFDVAFASVSARVLDDGSGNEDGELNLNVQVASTMHSVFSADSNVTISAVNDIYLRPTGDTVYMQGNTVNEQLSFQLNTTQQTITASDALSLDAATDIYLKPTGDDIFMRGTTSGEEIQFNLGASEQTITSSDALTFRNNSNTFTFKAETVDLSSRPIDMRIVNTDTGPLDGDTIGSITFRAENALNTEMVYGRIEAQIDDTSFATEDGDFSIYNLVSGTETRVFRAEGSTTTLSGGFVNLVSDGSIQFNANSTGYYSSYAINQPSASSGGYRHFMINSPNTNTSNGDISHELIFQGYNGSGFYSDWARIKVGIVDATNGSEDGKLEIFTEKAGSNALCATFEDTNLTVQGDVTSISDIRTKENIETITDGLEIVDSLRGVRYNKIGKEDRKVGVIAQEVEEVLPEVINTDNEGMKSVDYGKMVGVLIEAIKDLKSEVDMLKLKLGE